MRAAGAAVLASDCVCCRRPMGWGLYGVCEFCWSEAARFAEAPCDLCGGVRASRVAQEAPSRTCARCSGAQRACAAVTAWGPYEGRLRGLIRSLKYEGRWRLARPLGRMIVEAVLADGLAEWDLRDVAVVPVPLSRDRAADRGYNQSLLLAEEVGRRLRRLEGGGAPIAEALVRYGGAPTQTGLTRKERLRNLLGAYGAAPRKGRRVEGRRVLLIDDVITTGATVEACSRVLRATGALEVRAGVVARTLPPGRAGDEPGGSRGRGISEGGIRERTREAV